MIENKTLDSSQEEASSSTSMRTRVVASAGSGKTLTILTSIVNDIRKGDKASDILLLAFNADVRKEVRIRIKKESEKESNHKIKEQLSLLDDRIHTFHSYCNHVLRYCGDETEETKTILGDGTGNNISEFLFIDDIIQLNILTNEKDSKLLREFFSYYLNIDTNNVKDYKTLKNNNSSEELILFQKKIPTSHKIIEHGQQKNLYVRSYEEKMIVEWLDENNYKFMYEDSYKPDGYPGIPDFHIILDGTDKADDTQKTIHIWHEHFGLDKNKQPNPNFSAIEKKRYLDSYKQKIKYFENNKDEYLITYSCDFNQREGDIFSKLENNIKRIISNNNIELSNGKGVCISDKEYFDLKRNEKSNNSFRKFSKLMSTFMNNFRVRDVSFKDIERKIDVLTSYEKERAIRFYELFKKIYSYYEDNKKEKKKRDFADMLIHGKKFINEPNLKKLVVDEFQDMSDLRTRVCQKILDSNNAKALVVGDDAQSIYSFTGSDLEYIGQEFDNYFGKSSLKKLKKTYRFTTEMAQLSSAFVMQNKNQISKELEGTKSKHSYIPLQIIDAGETYNFDFSLRYLIYRKLYAIFKLDQNIEKILFLTRNKPENYKFNNFNYLDFMSQLKRVFSSKRHLFEFNTIHKSKGDEADYVFILHIKSGSMSFPSSVTDDKVLTLVKDDYYQIEEERRLFYVALTRAKKKVYMFTESDNQFNIEIQKLPNITYGKHYHTKYLSSVSNPTEHIVVKSVSANSEYPKLRRDVCVLSLNSIELKDAQDIHKIIRENDLEEGLFEFKYKNETFSYNVIITKDVKENGFIKYYLPFKYALNEKNPFINKITNEFSETKKANKVSNVISKAKISKNLNVDTKSIKISKDLFIKRDKHFIEQISDKVKEKFKTEHNIIHSSGYFFILSNTMGAFINRKRPYKIYMPNKIYPFKRCMPRSTKTIEQSILKILQNKKLSYSLLKSMGRWEWKIIYSSNQNAINKKLYNSKYRKK